MASRPPAMFGALPPYLCGKRRLVPLIFAALGEAVPPAAWPEGPFLDPCSGGGAVALAAKARGFPVIASDAAERAVVVARALIANGEVRLAAGDVLALLQAEPVAEGPAAVSGRFLPAQAAFLDAAFAHAARQREPRRSLLQLLGLHWALTQFPMSLPSASDAPAAAGGDYDRCSPRRVGHYLRAQRRLGYAALWRFAQRINAGVLPGTGEARRGDACATLAGTAAAVAYLDPPYAGTAGYAANYALIDALLGAAPPPDAAPDLDALLDAGRAIPTIVLSYGGPTTTLAALAAQVGRHRRVVRALAVPYPHLRSLARKESARASQEYLIVACR